MMITVHIGTDSRSLSDADAQWVTQQVNNRRKDNAAVCVRVEINEAGLRISLATPECGGGGGGGRPPNRDEAEIFELWKKHKLDTSDFAAGNVVAFLKQLARFV